MGSRRPVPPVEEYWGCRRSCGDAGKHTEQDGCVKYTPPCDHPLESIGYDSEGEGREVCCQDCQVSLSVRKLAEEATVGLSVGGCFCPEVCTWKCPPARPSAWSLDPAKVLRVLELEEHL